MNRASFTNVPQEVWDDLETQIAIHLPDEGCVDNRRAYRVRDGLHKSDFVTAENSGCCGFYNSYSIVDGDMWFVGCNYGH